MTHEESWDRGILKRGDGAHKPDLTGLPPPNSTSSLSGSMQNQILGTLAVRLTPLNGVVAPQHDNDVHPPLFKFNITNPTCY